MTIHYHSRRDADRGPGAAITPSESMYWRSALFTCKRLPVSLTSRAPAADVPSGGRYARRTRSFRLVAGYPGGDCRGCSRWQAARPRPGARARQPGPAPGHSPPARTLTATAWASARRRTDGDGEPVGDRGQRGASAPCWIACSWSSRQARWRWSADLRGAGKSTLLAVAAGVLRPDAGEVAIAGRKLGRCRPDRCPTCAGTSDTCRPSRRSFATRARWRT